MHKSEEEWNMIQRKKGNKLRKQSQQLAASKCDQSGSSADSTIPNYPGKLPPIRNADDQEVEQIHNRIERCREQLKNDGFRDHLKGRLAIATAVDQYAGLGIRNSVVVGIGSLDSSLETDHWRAAWQIASFLELMQALSDSKGEAGTSMSLQEPVLTSNDVKALSDVGFTVVPVPEAVEQIDEETLLFAPFIDWPVLFLHILHGKNPKVYVGADLESQLDSLTYKVAQADADTQVLENSLDVAREFVRNRHVVPIDFQHFGGNNLLGLQMYVR